MRALMKKLISGTLAIGLTLSLAPAISIMSLAANVVNVTDSTGGTLGSGNFINKTGSVASSGSIEPLTGVEPAETATIEGYVLTGNAGSTSGVDGAIVTYTIDGDTTLRSVVADSSGKFTLEKVNGDVTLKTIDAKNTKVNLKQSISDIALLDVKQVTTPATTSIPGDNTLEVPKGGEDVLFSITPKDPDGYGFSKDVEISITIGGVDYNAEDDDLELSITQESINGKIPKLDVAGDIVITAVNKVDEIYTVTLPSAGVQNGSLSEGDAMQPYSAGVVKVVKGDNAYIGLTPDSGYSVSSLQVVDSNDVILSESTWSPNVLTITWNELSQNADQNKNLTIKDINSIVYSADPGTPPSSGTGTPDDNSGEDGEKTDGESGETTDGEGSDSADGEGSDAAGESPFSDVVKSGDNDPYYDAIVWAAKNNVVKGKSDTSYDPNGTATRVEFTTMMHRLLKDIVPGNPGKTSKFADCQNLIEDFTNAILWAESLEPAIIQGVDANNFAPNAPITRTQVVTLIWRAAGSPEPKSTTTAFTDLTADYYKKAVAWGVEQGIVKGTSATTFDPDTPVTRAQLATFLYRAVVEAKVFGAALVDDASTGSATGEGTTSEGDATADTTAEGASEGDAAATDGDKADEGTDSESASNNAA